MKSDESGFLQGTPLTDQEAEEQQRVAEAAGVDVHRIAGDTRAIRRMMERAVTSPLPTVTPRGKDGRPMPSVVASLRSRDVDRIREAVVPRGRVTVAAQRDAGGRFVAGGGSSPAATGTLQKALVAMAGRVGALSGSVAGADRLDPALSALREVRDVVSPVGRGFMALHNRMAERKKERWYSRILKAITGRKEEVARGGGVADVGRGSFMGTFFGETIGNLAGRLPALLTTVFTRILAPVAAVWAGWQIGQYIGGKIYEWLDKSGIATKVFDAFDSVGAWFKEKVEAVKPVVKAVADKFEAAKTDVAERVQRNISTGLMNNWDRAKKHLVGASEQAGVDPGVVARIAKFESGFSMHARPRRRDGSLMSSAHGYGQLLDSTWVEMINKHGAKYGVAGAGSLSKAQALTLRDDPRLQAGMLAELTRENLALGRKLGGASDDANVYALHNLGSGDGSRFLNALKSNPVAPVSSLLSAKVISNNKSLYGDGSISVADAYRRMGAKMAEGNVFAAEVATARSPSIKAASVPAVSSTSIPSIKPATVPMSVPDKPAVVQAAPVPERLSSGSRQPTVVISKEDVNQDVRDRRLAHIVTGGIGG